jgi:hypothetical protein
VSDFFPEKANQTMAATLAKPRPQTRLERLSSLKVDTSVRGTEQDRIQHQLKTLEDWRPVREKVCK